MAVSGKTAAPIEAPYFLDSDAPPNMATVTKAMSDRLHALIGAFGLDEVLDGSATKGQILIAQSGDVARFKEISGDGTIDEEGVFLLAASIKQALIPVGTLLPTTLEEAPSGFLIPIGADIARSTYSALFAAWGTRYGTGNGSTTFGTPDLRGRVVVGKGTHSDVNSLIDTDGLSVGSRTPKTSGTFSGTTGVDSKNVNIEGGTSGNFSEPADRDHTHQFSGTTSAHGPAYAVANWMVKY